MPAPPLPARAARARAAFERPVLVAALLVVPALVLERAAAEPWGSVGVLLNWTIWAIFAAELVVMLALTDDRRAYLRHHPLDLAIVLLTPPLLPAEMQAGRSLRLLRLLRLVKTATVLRRVLSAEGVRNAAFLAATVVVAGGATFAAIERDAHDGGLTTWDGIWWAVTTVTTVGYGDVSPQTDGGRVLAIAVMVVGIGFVALVTAAAAERFIRGPEHRPDPVVEQLAAIEQRLERLELMLTQRGPGSRPAPAPSERPGDPQ